MCDVKEGKTGPLGAVHAAGTDEARAIEVEENILSENDKFALKNREVFEKHHILALNLVSSPGSGKTTLLTKTLTDKRLKASVIEGDQQTQRDADRIRETGVPVVQITTGAYCHLEANMVGKAMKDIGVPSGELDHSVLFIENVGNLVCPSAYDLGEKSKVVFLSVTEGDDKPLKYPDMFIASDLLVITKTDLLPHVDFDIGACESYAKQINPNIEVLRVSAKTGEGLDAWIDWIATRMLS